MLAAPPLQPMPLVVLSADVQWGPLVPGFIADGMLAPDTPPDVGYVTDRAQKVAHATLAALVPGAKHVTKTDSGHVIHHDNPQLVTDSIREVVDAVRAGQDVPGAVAGRFAGPSRADASSSSDRHPETRRNSQQEPAQMFLGARNGWPPRAAAARLNALGPAQSR